MVDEVRADAGRVEEHLDSRRLERLARADSGELQQMRRPDRARAQHHLTGVVRDLLTGAVQAIDDPGRATALDHDAGRSRPGHVGEVRPAARRRR